MRDAKIEDLAYILKKARDKNQSTTLYIRRRAKYSLC